jgi:anaerobic magnesium-protoporphyrin IX monomethyl ester cyclase
MAEEMDLVSGTLDDVGDTAWTHTVLAFPAEHKRQVEHRQRLFALGVEWPWPEPIIRRLIRLPHNAVIDATFWWLHKLHKGLAILLRVYPARLRPGQIWMLVLYIFKVKS